MSKQMQELWVCKVFWHLSEPGFAGMVDLQDCATKLTYKGFAHARPDGQYTYRSKYRQLNDSD